ncbi:MAG: hypothetical protein WCS88_03310 [Patescibacteria group bacterium]|jgi:hypothetical protein
MKFIVNNNKYNILNLIRKISYHPHKNNKSFSRLLGASEFPRFHIYIKNLKDAWEFSLHLDQKGACYDGQTAHSGDYDGEILEKEKERIINLLKD